MSRSDPQFKLRLPLELKERIEEDAKKNKRSINAEIVSCLESEYLSQSKNSIERLEQKLDLILRKLNASKD